MSSTKQDKKQSIVYVTQRRRLLLTQDSLDLYTPIHQQDLKQKKSKTPIAYEILANERRSKSTVNVHRSQHVNTVYISQKKTLQCRSKSIDIRKSYPVHQEVHLNHDSNKMNITQNKNKVQVQQKYKRTLNAKILRKKRNRMMKVSSKRCFKKTDRHDEEDGDCIEVFFYF